MNWLQKYQFVIHVQWNENDNFSWCFNFSELHDYKNFSWWSMFSELTTTILVGGPCSVFDYDNFNWWSMFSELTTTISVGDPCSVFDYDNFSWWSMFSELTTTISVGGPCSVNWLQQFQLVVHVGVSGMAEEITLEQQAHNNGYNKLDVNGTCPANSLCIDDADECVISEIDMEQVCRYVNQSGIGVKAVVSTDPGRLEYQYFSIISDRDVVVKLIVWSLCFWKLINLLHLFGLYRRLWVVGEFVNLLQSH